MPSLIVKIDYSFGSGDWLSARWLEQALSCYLAAADFKVAEVVCASPDHKVHEQTKNLAAQLKYLSDTLGLCLQDESAEGLAALVSAIKN